MAHGAVGVSVVDPGVALGPGITGLREEMSVPWAGGSTDGIVSLGALEPGNPKKVLFTEWEMHVGQYSRLKGDVYMMVWGHMILIHEVGHTKKSFDSADSMQGQR